MFNENFRLAAEAEYGDWAEDGDRGMKMETPVVTIECVGEEEELCREYGVADYPTVRLFRRNGNGSGEGEVEVEVERYRGKRSSEAYVQPTFSFSHFLIF